MPLQIEFKQLKRRRTKVVATIGPASADPAVIRRLVEAGANVFRLNFSHGDHQAHGTALRNVRDVGRELGVPLAVLADLCGPKIRVGRFEGGEIELRQGEKVVVTTRDVPGKEGLIPSAYEALARDVRPGNHILLDDGKLELVVEGVDGSEITCAVVRGGTLRDRKGMNLPDVAVSSAALTDKDRNDAIFALSLGVDYIALSFVRRGGDVRELRELMESTGLRAPIISKIEKPEALANIDEIIAESDGLMVARGDLGVELMPEAVPMAQAQLVDLARAAGKPVIIATQMLESMIEHGRPTRAEVADVSEAVRSGADAVMLSAETASGRYPVESVEMMDRVARQTEAYLWKQGGFQSIVDHELGPPPLLLDDAVARAAAQLSRDLMVRALVTTSSDPTTAAVLSAARPQAPLLALTSDSAAYRRMALYWGVYPVLAEEHDLKNTRDAARRAVVSSGLAAQGDYVLQISGFREEGSDEPVVAVVTV
jgi:pyruvate kinase